MRIFRTKYKTDLFQFGSMTMTRIFYRHWFMTRYKPMTWGFGTKKQAEEWLSKIIDKNPMETVDYIPFEVCSNELTLNLTNTQ